MIFRFAVLQNNYKAKDYFVNVRAIVEEIVMSDYLYDI